MSELQLYILFYLIAVFVSSISQIMLKKSANFQYENKLKEYLNPYVIFAYSIFVIVTFLVIYAYRVVPLSLGPVLDATMYIYIPLLSMIFLKEKLNKKQLVGYFLIIIGIVVYTV